MLQVGELYTSCAFPAKHPIVRKRSNSAISQAPAIVAKKAFSKNCRKFTIRAVTVKERIYITGGY